MSPYADWFVGGVTIALGAGALWGAASANRYVFEMPKMRLLESSVGRTSARAILSLVGIALIALGIGIAIDWKWPWSTNAPLIETRSVSEGELLSRLYLAHASGFDARGA